MSAISLKSISGITSITTPAGVDNQLTLHTNDTTQRVKVTQSGIEVVGVATFQDIDVDGHTNLDNVNISGVTTATTIKSTSQLKLIAAAGNSGAGGTWRTYTAGIATNKSVGINTNDLDDNDLVGVGNSFQGLYISNGMMITDNKLSGNHYIGTAFNGLMAGPVTINGTLTVEGNYVVV